jgi:hypothetical protein
MVLCRVFRSSRDLPSLALRLDENAKLTGCAGCDGRSGRGRRSGRGDGARTVRGRGCARSALGGETACFHSLKTRPEAWGWHLPVLAPLGGDAEPPPPPYPDAPMPRCPSTAVPAATARRHRLLRIEPHCPAAGGTVTVPTADPTRQPRFLPQHRVPRQSITESTAHRVGRGTGLSPFCRVRQPPRPSTKEWLPSDPTPPEASVWYYHACCADRHPPMMNMIRVCDF